MLGYTTKYPFARTLGSLCMLIGIFGMVTAGYILVIGLSNFGNDQLFSIFVILAFVFQFTEYSAFVGASLPYLPSIRRRWLFVIGCVLFCFSVGIMTVAQKTALESAQSQASTIDDKTEKLESQIKSLDSVIAGLLANGNKQSKSRFAQSRKAGQTSLLQAAELIEKQSQLINQLEQTRNFRKKTTRDFFSKSDNAKNIEFWLIACVSLLLELSSVTMLSFATFLFGKVSEIVTEKQDNSSKMVTENSVTIEKPVTIPVTIKKEKVKKKQEVNPNSSNIITEKIVTEKPKTSNDKSSKIVTGKRVTMIPKKYEKQYNRFLMLVKKPSFKITNKGVREAVKVGTDNATKFLEQACVDGIISNHGVGKGYTLNLH